MSSILIFPRPATKPANVISDDWREHPSVVVSYLTTAIIIGWTEGKDLSVSDCVEAMPEIKTYMSYQDWTNAQAAARMIAQATGMKIPQEAK